MMFSKIFSIIGAILLICDASYSARILCLYALSSKSHKNFALPVLEALAEKGHEITWVSPFKTNTKNPNIKDIIVHTDEESIMEKLGQPMVNRFQPGQRKLFPMLKTISHFMDYFSAITEVFSASEQVQELANQKFDLILYNGIFNEMTFGLIHKIGAPFVEFYPSGTHVSITEKTGTPSPTSFLPMGMTPYSSRSKMTFFERTVNLVSAAILSICRQYIYFPHVQNDLAKVYTDVPDLRDFELNVSLILTNGNSALNGPKPLLPNVVEVGGVHCRDAKPLPKDLESFASGSGDEGFIYFSLGSVAQGSSMPEEMRLAFLGAFSKLKQRVLWKWETETMEGLPPNVKLSKWLPQQDILGHPKLKLFMTHGGLLSTQEAIYHGVPLVGLPLFADQGLNMANAERDGYGVKLDLENITTETVFNALQKVLNEPSYRRTIKELSVLFRDQYPSPLDRAVYWIEYVIRHKGAHHLKSIGATLPWYQYHSLDVYAFLISIVVISIAVIYAVLKTLVKCICCRKKCSTKKEKVN